MNLREEMEQLERKKSSIQQQMKNCQHEFLPAKYDPETKKEITYTTVARGSDIYPEPTGSYDKKVDRWSRECSKCGKIEYTYTQEPVIKEYQPKFS